MHEVRCLYMFYGEEDYGFFNDDSELYELDRLICDFKQSLKNSVKDEVKSEIESLKAELEELREFRDKKDLYDKNIQELKHELDTVKESIDERAAKMRVSDVLLTLKKETWVADCKWQYIKPKCDKCGDDRIIHFKSPSGKDLTERCDCSKQVPVHSPSQAFLVEIDNDDFYKHQNTELPSTVLRYVPAYEIDHDSDGNYQFKLSRLYDGKDFNELNTQSIYFRDYDECNRYCKWLNDKYIRENNIEVEVEL